MKHLITLLIASTLITSCGSGSGSNSNKTTDIKNLSYNDALPTTAEDIQQKYNSYEKKGLYTETYSKWTVDSLPVYERLIKKVYLKTIQGSIYILRTDINLNTGDVYSKVVKEGYTDFISDAGYFKYYKKNNIYLKTQNENTSASGVIATTDSTYDFTDANYFTVKYHSAVYKNSEITSEKKEEVKASYVSDIKIYESQLKSIQFCNNTAESTQCQDNQDMTWLLN